MNTLRFGIKVCGTLSIVISLLILSLSNAALAGWDDWWQTPEQKAASAFEAGDHQRLLEEAPDSDWTGLGQFQSGDYQGAAETFKQYEQQQRSQGNNEDATRALYNQGVSETLAGRYQEAIDNFDRVLADDPDYTDAAHNKQLAEQLLTLQEQQEQQGEGEDGEQDQSGEQDGQSGDSSDGDSGEQSGEQQDQQGEQGDQSQANDQSGESTEGQENSSGENGDEAQAGDNTDDESQSLSDEQRQQDAEDAARALQAEAQQEQQQTSDEQSQAAAQVTEQPMSESEQATEQLLRRIPDDPAGLLRRKLEQSHRSEFPEVRDALEPW